MTKKGPTEIYPHAETFITLNPLKFNVSWEEGDIDKPPRFSAGEGANFTLNSI